MTIETPPQRAWRGARPDSSIAIVSLAVTLLTVAGAGCDSAARKVTDGSGGGGGHAGQPGSGGAGAGVQATGGHGGETGSGGAGPSVDAATECHQALGALSQGACPPLFGDEGWEDSVCRSSFALAVEERTCDAYQVLSVRWAVHGYACYYEKARHTLIGARFYNDIASFCDNTSFTVNFGEVPPLDSCAAPLDRRAICIPDGGVSERATVDTGADDAAATDGGVPDVAPEDTASGADGDVCRGGQIDARPPIGNGCPLAFLGTSCLRSSITPVEAIVYEQRCEGYRRRNYGFGTFAYHCYYEPTTLTLVAAEYFDDVPQFCGRSYGITYGAVPPSGACETSTLLDKPCPSDASAD